MAALGATSFVVANAATDTAHAGATDCWDEYTLTGTTIQRVITPRNVTVGGCTVPTACLDGWSANGRTRNRILVPRGLPKSFCTTTQPTTTTVAPTTVAPTTVAPTTVAPTTVAPTTVAPTTVAPTTVAPTTVAPTTVAPTTVAPTTVPPTTVPPTTVPPTTVPPTTVPPTTVAPTTVAPTTTQPSAGAFVEVFDAASDLDQWDIEVHHRADHDGGQPSGTWQADHGLTCGDPASTKRTLNANDRSGSVFWCPNGGGHVMTSMGEVDGYSTVSMSPKKVFATVRKVCWDQNVSASLGARQWVEVLIVPNSIVNTPHPSGHRITFNNPFLFDIDGTVRPHVPGVVQVGVAPISGDTGMIVNGVISPDIAARFGSPNDPEGRDSVAIRRTHCLTELSGNRVEFRVATGGADWVGIANGVQLPDNSRVILSTHHYTPTKDQGFDVTTTWHWDNVIVE